MVLVQQWPVFIVFFLSNVGQGNVFYDILEKKAFRGFLKQEPQKGEKNTFFQRG